MTVSFPANFKCPSEFHDLYPDVERQMLPIIKKKAKRLRLYVPYLDMDDAIQEGRLALLSCLARFDWNKANGDLKRYVRRALTNTYHCMLFEVLAQCRMPHAVVMEDGEWKKVPRAPVSLDDLVGWEPEIDLEVTDNAMEQEALEEQAKIMKLRLINNLKGRDYDVFMCIFNPPVDFMVMVDNKRGESACPVNAEAVAQDATGAGWDPTNLEIAAYLDVSKNTVDWCLHKIRSQFTQLAKGDFSDMFQEHIKGGGWPMIHLSRTNAEDKEFKHEVIKVRKLDPKPLVDSHQRDDSAQLASKDDERGHWARLIERYPWGCYLVLKRGSEYCTLVIEGRFNPSTGEVFGDSGAREKIPVDWYPELVRKLKKSTGG